jgi:uridine phosphorylase
MLVDIYNVNFPMDAEGRTYHVGLKRGEVSNRILTVGDPTRARRLALLLDTDAPKIERETNRGFLTITGKYAGQPVSIIAIGMGLAMMDFMLREVRAVVDGPMYVIRLGTCGSIGDARPGDIIVPPSSAAVLRNYDAFFDLAQPGSKKKDNVDPSQCYFFTKPFCADQTLTELLRHQMEITMGAERVVSGMNITADAFYASQGRVDVNFVDRNHGHLERILERYPDAVSLEMENFALFHLARCATPLKSSDKPSIRAAAAMIVVFQRWTDSSLSKADLASLETRTGQAVLEVLANSLKDEVELNGHIPTDDEAQQGCSAF